MLDKFIIADAVKYKLAFSIRFVKKF